MLKGKFQMNLMNSLIITMQTILFHRNMLYEKNIHLDSLGLSGKIEIPSPMRIGIKVNIILSSKSLLRK